MKKFTQFLGLTFLPTSADLGLLLLRVGFGTLMITHGWGKIGKLTSDLPVQFYDFLGIGATPSLCLAIFAEVFCAALLVVGAFTRFAALACAITMLVAFFGAHSGKISEGEMALLYTIPFVVLVLTGGGRYAIDTKLPAFH